MIFERKPPLRPLLRWAETAAAATVSFVLLWTGLDAAFGGAWLGWVVAALGLAALLWLWTAFSRARLAHGEDGPGVVEVAEGRVAYLAPDPDPDLPFDSTFHGGVVSLSSLWSVEAIELKRGAGLAWRLRPEGGGPVVIPISAEGADQLPETLSALPGFSMRRAGRAFEERGLGVRPIWRRSPHPTEAGHAFEISQW